jgi:hypothetical protein
MIIAIIILIIVAIIIYVYAKKQTHQPKRQQSHEEHQAEIIYTIKAPLGNDGSNNKAGDKTITVNIDLDEIMRQPKRPKLDIEISDDMIKIDSLNFYGEYQKSPNGLYLVGCCDFHYEDDKIINGKIVLIKQNEIVYHKVLKRPNYAKVADNGYVVVMDWLSYDDELAGVYYAFDNKGKEVIKQQFKANLFDDAITPSGTYAACSTCASDYEPHSNMLFLYDLSSKSLVLTFECPTFIFRIDEASQTIHFDETGTHWIYDFRGKQLNGPDLRTLTSDYLNRGYGIYFSLSEELKANESGLSTLEDYQPYIDKLKSVIEILPSAYWISEAYKQIGDIYLILSMDVDAKQCYENALLNNPKAPVKRKLQKLTNS